MHLHCLKLKHKKADNNYIELVGFDGTVKNTYNMFSVGRIIGDVKEMPMGDIKCNLSLFADYHPKTSVKGYGFKDEEEFSNETDRNTDNNENSENKESE